MQMQLQLQTGAVRPEVWSNHQDGVNDWDSSTGRTRRSGVTNTALQLRSISTSLAHDLVPASRLAGSLESVMSFALRCSTHMRL